MTRTHDGDAAGSRDGSEGSRDRSRRTDGPGGDRGAGAGGDHPVGRLHRRYGNRAVQWLAERGVQPALRVGSPTDPAEREAERVADAVTSATARNAGHRAPAGRDATGRDAAGREAVDRNATGRDETRDDGERTGVVRAARERVAARPTATGTAPAPPVVTEALRRPGRPLDAGTRGFMESRFCQDFSGVRLHTDDRAAESARAIGAVAYTAGEDVVVDADRRDPSGSGGRRLLAHELAHVVQQGGGRPLEPEPTGESDARAGGAASRVGSRSGVGSTGPLRRVVQRQELDEERMAASPLNDRCYRLLTAPGSSTVGLGLAVEARIEEHFQRTVGPTEGFAIPSGTADPRRTEGRPGDDSFIDPEVFETIDPHPLKGTGRPDLAYRNGSTMELIEVKPAHWHRLWEAEYQVDRYVEQGNADHNADLRQRLGVAEFARMPRSRYRPPSMLFVGGKRIAVAWCTPGVILYKPLQGRRQPDRDPVTEPVYVPWAEAAAAMTAKALQQLEDAAETVHDNWPWVVGGVTTALTYWAVRQLSPVQRMRTVAGAAAAIVALSATNATAQIGGDGEDPIRALYRLMAENGTPAPPALQERIESNPALRERLSEALESGDTSAAQAALDDEMREIVARNAEEFTEEELAVMLGLTEWAADESGSGSARTAAELRRMLRRTRAGEGADEPEEASGDGSGTGAGTDRRPPDADAGSTADDGPGTDDGGAPGDDSRPPRERIRTAPAPVRRVFDAIVEPGRDGPEVTGTAIERFLAVVPSDLSEDQARRVVARISGGEAESVEAVIEELDRVIGAVHPGEDVDPAAEADAGRDESADSRDGAGEATGSRDEAGEEDLVARLRPAIDEFDGWDEIDVGRVMLVVSGLDAETDAGETVAGRAYARYSGGGGRDGRAVAAVTVRVTAGFDDEPAGTVVCEIQDSTPWVREDRRTRPSGLEGLLARFGSSPE